MAKDLKLTKHKRGVTPGNRGYDSYRYSDGSKLTVINPRGERYKKNGDPVREHVKSTSPKGKVTKYTKSASSFGGGASRTIKKSYTTKRRKSADEF